MVSLGLAAARGRDNNLNLLRMAAAAAVLVSHAWPIALGPGAVQPLKAALGETLGTYAVYIFFVLSGFLIAASFERSGGAGNFWAARGARLFPGLVVANLLLVFLLGPLTTLRDLGAYFGAGETWAFLLGNSAILKPVFSLPGVFETNPYPTVHGSIWTLRHELACYLLLFGLGMAGLLARRTVLLVAVPLVYLGLWAGKLWLGPALPGVVREFIPLSFPFMLGALAWVWRARIPLSLWGVALSVGLAWLCQATPLAWLAQMLCLAYLSFWLAYVPGGWLRGYNRLGDYSYGLYIYAFPIQGLVVWAFGPTTPLVHCLLAFPPTLALAVLSWHLVERPALARGRQLFARRPLAQREPRPL